MQDTIRSLTKLGFALHLLHPKSKRPIETGWTKGSPKKVDELLKSFKPGMNIGVRLGAASKLGEKYLAVIDCDVKSTFEDAGAELTAKLHELFEDKAFQTPMVLSGRGNGSRHIYVLTDKPAAPRRLAQSVDKVQVHMPSVKATKHELSALSKKQISEGIRLRHAWEISLMGEGQQVVLPPSLHPDTGRKYKWSKGEPANIDEFFTLSQVVAQEKSTENAVLQDFKVADIDLLSTGLSDAMVDLIVSGEGNSDRSAGLMSACHAMVGIGLTDDQILTVLTDKDNYLGRTGFDHANTDSRKKAAEWVFKHTLRKVKDQKKADSQFEAVVEISVQNHEIDAAVQEGDLMGDWISRLIKGKNGNPANCLQNIHSVLTNALGPDIFKFNEFVSNDEVWRENPWGLKIGTEFNERSIAEIQLWCSKAYRFQPSVDNIWNAITAIANQNKYHPVRDYLNSLPDWDGISRVDNFLRDYMKGEAPEEYLRAISRKTLCAMVARVMEPGIKFDYMLILEGDQGLRKSTAIKTLVGSKWFSDAELDTKHKDSIHNMLGKWVFEQAELDVLDKASISSLKRFVSCDTDRMRPSHGRKSQDYPRQCIFIGSTNEDIYLKDQSANRRFWPFKVTGKCNVDHILQDKDQIFAETMMFYLAGEPIWLEDEEIEKIAKKTQEDRTSYDELISIIAEWIKEQPMKSDPPLDTTRLAMKTLFSNQGPFVQYSALNLKFDNAGQRRVGEALRYLKYKRKTERIGGTVCKVWVKCP